MISLAISSFAQTLDEAGVAFNQGIQFSKAYYGLGLVYKKQENLPLMKQALDTVMVLAGDDAKTIGNAKDAMTSAYQKAGAEVQVMIMLNFEF